MYSLLRVEYSSCRLVREIKDEVELKEPVDKNDLAVCDRVKICQ